MLLNRRSLLLSSLISGLTGKLKFANAAKNVLNPELVKLGNTDLIIPNIGYGSSSTSDERIVKHAFNNGIRYFDTAESYHGGDSEISIGNALKNVRQEVVIGSKTTSKRKAVYRLKN